MKIPWEMNALRRCGARTIPLEQEVEKLVNTASSGSKDYQQNRKNYP